MNISFENNNPPLETPKMPIDRTGAIKATFVDNENIFEGKPNLNEDIQNELENSVEGINKKFEEKRLSLLSRFWAKTKSTASWTKQVGKDLYDDPKGTLESGWENNKTKITLATMTTPAGGAAIGYEMLKGETLDGYKIEGANRVAYGFLAATKIFTSISTTLPLLKPFLDAGASYITGEDQEVISMMTAGAATAVGLTVGNAWLPFFLASRLSISPEIITDYLDENPKLKSKLDGAQPLKERLSEMKESLAAVKDMVVENIEYLDMSLLAKIGTGNESFLEK